MNRSQNPFAPGAGHQPPELAGRDHIIEDASVALQRVKAGRPERGQLLLGLRGVGKTVLLNRLEAHAEAQSYLTAFFEAPEHGRLAQFLAPQLRSILVKLSHREQAKMLARKALGTLRAFASAFEVSMGAVDIAIKPESGVADSGNLEIDLPDLLLAVANAAKASGEGVVLFIDEVQYLSRDELSALIVAMHRVSQKNLPMILFGAGLPQLAGILGEAKSYAERLFRYPKVGPLTEAAARDAVQRPLEDAGVQITSDALTHLIKETEGYPYFLQEWGYHAWNLAAESPITLTDVKQAGADAQQQLDRDFFQVRFDRLSNREKDYMRAMADLGTGPHRSANVARHMGLAIGQTSQIRNSVIAKGMAYSPEYGSVAFTVPMFDAYMRRSMPSWKPPRATSRTKNRKKRSKR